TEIIPYLHQKKILLSIISDTDEDWIRGQLKKDGLLEFFSEFYLSFQIGLWLHKRPVRALHARFWHPVGCPEDIDHAHDYVAMHPDERLN
ncbi:MAG: hypothetical protein AAB855_03680, partial [Patescibacteria group bacterium]